MLAHRDCSKSNKRFLRDQALSFEYFYKNTHLYPQFTEGYKFLVAGDYDKVAEILALRENLHRKDDPNEYIIRKQAYVIRNGEVVFDNNSCAVFAKTEKVRF
jgi:hypothetical protein